ncbi:hypothetical protein [Bacillus sp. JJ1764]|uniref:hypothetical protein n=1 Tax=Bacillus sp. JJ1764 TaxID=3122964 RepID=UPI002FFECE3D
MEDIVKAIAKYPNKEMFLIEWANGFKIEAELDTIYETCNDLEYGEPGYKEYRASCFRIKKILQHSNESRDLKLTEGHLYEVSMEEPPVSLFLLSSGNLIWQNSIG